MAGGDTAEVLEPPEHALDGVAVAVEERREAVLPTPIGLRRDVGHPPFALDLVTDRVAVIALVTVQDRALRHLFQKQVTGGAVSNLATGQKESNRTAQAIGQGVDLGGAPAA